MMPTSQHNTTPSLLTIAGTDPCSGAGIPADLAVMRALGYHGLSVVTSVVAQNTSGISSTWHVPKAHILAQLETILADIAPVGVKIGVLGDPDVVSMIATKLDTLAAPIVLDPVLAGGQDDHDLGGRAVAEAIQNHLLARVTLITPNAPEATALTGIAIHDPKTQRAAAKALVELGCAAALVKGGHVPGTRGDCLAQRTTTGTVDTTWFGVEHLYPYPVRGTGCHLATAICAGLATGFGPIEAVRKARSYLDKLWKEHAEPLGQGARVFVHTPQQGAHK